MSWRLIRSAPVLMLVTAFGAGCGNEEDDGASPPAEQQADLSLAGNRCTIRGEPAVTVGCAASEICVPVACTNSIPRSCVGTCRAQALPKRSSCGVSGDPPVTTGCADGQQCAVEACTNSIPPSCFGHCTP